MRLLLDEEGVYFFWGWLVGEGVGYFILVGFVVVLFFCVGEVGGEELVVEVGEGVVEEVKVVLVGEGEGVLEVYFEVEFVVLVVVD